MFFELLVRARAGFLLANTIIGRDAVKYLPVASHVCDWHEFVIRQLAVQWGFGNIH